MTAAPPGPLPVPAHFPIRWDQPGDEAQFWFQDLMHFPTPVTPLTATFQLPAFSAGSTRAIGRLSMPITGLRYTAFNSYVYGAAPPFLGTPAEMEARMGRMIETIGGIMPTLLQRFHAEYVPRILRLADDFRFGDYGSLPPDKLAQHIAAQRETLEQLWDIHMEVNIPPMAAVFGFDDFLASFLGPDAERSGHLMLQGFPNKSVESGHALWLLAQAARADAEVVQTLQQTPAARLPDALARTPAGRAFAEQWQTFLQQYGWRSGAFEFADPGWIEDGTVPLNQLRAYLARPDVEDPLVSQHRQAVERDRIVAETEAKLPQEAVPQFRMMLAGAQSYIPLAEDHNFYIDQMAFTSFRVPCLALGRELTVAGIIARPEDVFFLTFDDVVQIGYGHRSESKALVAQRQRELDHWRSVIPPEVVGTPPPADVPLDPLVTKFFGFGTELSTDARVIKGVGSSGGVATGTVKVVRTLDESDKIEPGDIMVCHMTMPAWTPLFAAVGAVVADSGGVLSHCSIVAREYGIPCVTATRIGTRTLRDGQRVTVDGNRGIVVIEG